MSRTSHFFNADDAYSLESTVAVAKAGFDSIVFDLSAFPFEQNVRQTRLAVEVLKSTNPAILVEGETGDIGPVPESHDSVPDRSTDFTTPEEAKQYIERTVRNCRLLSWPMPQNPYN